MNQTAAIILGGMSGTLILPACMVSPVAVLALAAVMVACIPSMDAATRR